MSGVSLQRGVNCEVELEGGPEASENGPVIVAVAPPPPPQEIDWRPLLAQLEQAEGEGTHFLCVLEVREPVKCSKHTQGALKSRFASPEGALRSRFAPLEGALLLQSF